MTKFWSSESSVDDDMGKKGGEFQQIQQSAVVEVEEGCSGCDS